MKWMRLCYTSYNYKQLVVLLGVIIFTHFILLKCDAQETSSFNPQPIQWTQITDLPEGWSMISYIAQDGMAPETAFAPIIDNLVIVKDGEGHVFWPAYDIDQIHNMARGKGYLIKVTSSLILQYPQSSQKIATVYEADLKHFTPVQNTDNNATIIVTTDAQPAIDSTPLTSGDEIGVFTPDGLCVGACVWEDSNRAITVWGDDAITTEKIDGMTPGEPYRFCIWDSDNDVEYRAVVTYESGDSTYVVDAIVVVDTLIGVSEEVYVEDPATPKEFSLSQNYPNPFNPITTITFALPHDSRVSLKIYNAVGEEVATLADTTFPAGKYSIEWDASEFSSGIYLYRIEADSFVETRKLLLLK